MDENRKGEEVDWGAEREFRMGERESVFKCWPLSYEKSLAKLGTTTFSSVHFFLGLLTGPDFQLDDIYDGNTFQ